MCIDDVARGGPGAELADRSGYLFVKAPFVDAPEQPCQEGLAGAPAPPRLCNTARRGDDPLPPTAGHLDEGRELAITAIEGDQPARVQHKAHSGNA